MRTLFCFRCLLFFCSAFIFKYSSAQTIVTWAGGMGNDTTTALYGRFSNPVLLADSVSRLYVSDDVGGLRRIDVATNRLSVVLTGGGKGRLDGLGNWYYINGSKVYKKDPSGAITHIAGNGYGLFNFDNIPATQAAIDPTDLVVDLAGNVYITDNNNNRVRRINTLGIISTYAGTGSGGFSGDGGPATAARLYYPSGIAIDGSGNIFITELGNRRVRKITTSGIISTLAGNGNLGASGDGGPATTASTMSPQGIVVDGDGNVYFADKETHNVRKINTSGIISRFAGTTTAGFAGDGGPATAAKLNRPAEIALSSTGGLYIADKNNNRIRFVNAAGTISTIAGNGIPFGGYGGDGNNALLGQFNAINWLAMGNAGSLYISDGNNRIRKIDAGGILSTVAGMGLGSMFGDGGQATAAGIGGPASVTNDKFGNFYIAAGDRVRKVTPSGIITVFAGGGGATPNGVPATDATIGQPKGMAADAAGNIYVTNSYGNEVYRIDAITGIITIIAGNGSGTTSGDGGPATAAGVDNPNSVAFDKHGNMYIGADQVRKVNTSGIISSLPIYGSCINVDTMGNVYTVYGSIVTRYDIHGYLSAVAGATPAYSIVIDTANNLFFAGGNIVRRMGPLSTVIDYPPIFAKGGSTNLTVCVSSTTNAMDTFLKVTDIDPGQILTWAVTQGPMNGSLGGLPYSAASTGGLVVPSGITYTPITGYVGSDVFKIRVSDGEDTAMIQVNVTVAATASAGSITGTSKVCVGASVDLNATIAGGTWSMSGTRGTINDTGLVTGVAGGIDTVIYTINTYCGLKSAIRTFTVNQVPVPQIEEPVPTLCVNVSTLLIGVPDGGSWGIVEGPLHVLSNGRLSVNTTGNGKVMYAVTNECGTGRDTLGVNAVDKPEIGTITGPLSGCPGDAGIFTGTIADGKWYSNNSIVATIDSLTGAVSMHAAGAAQISYRKTNVCGTSITSRYVTVPNSPNVGLIVGDDFVCKGASDTLIGTVGAGEWSIGDTMIATISTEGVIYGKSAGTTGVTYTVTNNCGTGNTNRNIIVQPSPELTPITGKSIIIKGTTVTLRGRAPVGIWSSSDETIASINQWGELKGVTNGNAIITYSETNGDNCTSMEIFAVQVTPSTNIVLSVYPIPASRILNVTYKMSAAMDADVQITDIIGRMMLKSKISMPTSTGVAQFDVSLFPAGVYTLSMICADGSYVGRVVVH